MSRTPRRIDRAREPAADRRRRRAIGTVLAAALAAGGCGSGAGGGAPDEPDPGLDSALPNGSETPDPVSLPWGEYGPFDDHARAAVAGYDGSLEPVELDLPGAATLFDTLLVGPFADYGQEIAPSIWWRSPLALLDRRVKRELDAWERDAAEAGSENCKAGGSVIRTILPPESNDRGAHVVLLDHDGCKDQDSVLDGRVVLAFVGETFGYRTDLFVGFDNAVLGAAERRLVIDGAQRHTYACGGRERRLETLLVGDPAAGESVLLDAVDVDLGGCRVTGTDLSRDISRRQWRGIDGRLAHSTLGSVEVLSGTPLRYLMTETATGLVDLSSGDEAGDDAAPEGEIELLGGGGTRARFSFRDLGLRYDHGNPVQPVAELGVESPNGAYEPRRAIVSNHDFRRGVLADLDDRDADGLPDGWERAYGLDPDDPEDAGADNDGDGLVNTEELAVRADPQSYDVPSRSDPLSVDESLRLELSAAFDEGGDEQVVRVDVVVDPGAGGTVRERGSYEVALHGEASWDASRLPDGCDVEADTSGGVSLVRCRYEYPFSPVAVSPFVAAPLFVLPRGDTALAVEGRLQSSPLERQPEDNVAVAALDHLEVPPVDFRVEAPERVFGNAESVRTLRATITQPLTARRTDLDVRVDVPAGLVVQRADLLSSGDRPPISRCGLAATVSCTMDEVASGETLTLEIGYTVVQDGVHELRVTLAAGQDDADAANDVAVTRVEHAAPIDPLQVLIDAAADGDTVTLPPGTYIGTLHGRWRELTVRGGGDGRVTVLISDDPEQALLAGIGARSTWGGLELRTSGAPIVADSGENMTIADSLIAPIEGMPHALTGLFEGSYSTSYRLLGNRIEGWGRGAGNRCASLFGSPGEQGADSTYLKYVYLQNNLFVGNDCEQLLRAHFEMNFQKALPHYFVTGNTFVDSPTLFRFSGSSGTTRAVFRNNLIVGVASPLEIDTGLFETRVWYDGLVSARNLLWNSGRESLLTRALLERSEITLERTDLHADPAFVDASSGDYRLSEGSPAVDAGVDPGPYEWTYDDYRNEGLAPPADAVIAPLDGNGDGLVAHDIGAFERSVSD